MNFQRFRSTGFVLCLIVMGSFPPSETVVLKGKVLDAADDSPIAGASIVAYKGKIKLPETISLADGTYSVRGFVKGDHIQVYYSRGGYKPNPMPSAVVLSKPENTSDIRLIRDTPDVKYWRSVATKIRTAVETRDQDEGRQIQLYEQTWSDLGAIGLSPESQAQAARQIASLAPRATASHSLMLFATIDDNDLRKAQGNISDAVYGKAVLSHEYSIPSDVAAVIAANELKKQGSGKPAEAKFSKDFESVWGAEAGKDLQGRLIKQECISSDPAKLPAECQTFDGFRNLQAAVSGKSQ